MKWLFVVLVVVATATGDILLTHGMKRSGEIHDFRPHVWLRSIVRALGNGWVLLGVGAMAVSFFSFLALLSTADVSFAVPATAPSFVVETLGARLLLGERVSRQRWAGSLLVMAGVALISL